MLTAISGNNFGVINSVYRFFLTLGRLLKWPLFFLHGKIVFLMANLLHSEKPSPNQEVGLKSKLYRTPISHCDTLCCFVLLTRGWGRLETRPQVALKSVPINLQPVPWKNETRNAELNGNRNSWLKSPHHSGFRLPFNSAFPVSSSSSFTERAVPSDEICRYKRLCVMFLDLFCDVLPTTKWTVRVNHHPLPVPDNVRVWTSDMVDKQ